MPKNTIFDDVFRTMMEKMPYLAVPLINEIFHTSDYIFRNEEKIRKGVDETMRGQVLELASEKIARLQKENEELLKEKERGIAQGEERMGILINRLILDGKSDEIQKVIADPELRKQKYKEYGL